MQEQRVMDTEAETIDQMQTDDLKEIIESPKWGNKIKNLITCVGFTVGFGNVWRFPYFCRVYGGAFLIPFLIALVLEGFPLLYMELAIGQRLRTGNVGVWKSISPYMGGLGVASMAVSFLYCLIFNMILAWTLWYFFHSFQNPLPWKDCPLNSNHTGYVSECEESSPVNYYWYRSTLNITPNIETTGTFEWWLVVCLASAWCIVYIFYIRGMETIEKAVYVLFTFPYLVLTIFLVKALTLSGASDGLTYLFTPNWETLKNPDVWLDAATQIFLSFSLAFGGLIAFSSDNPQKNNCERDALIVGCVSTLTSLYASLPIFSILGFKANEHYDNCRNWNILTLTNTFNIGDENITYENYDDWLSYLNRTHPSEVESLDLKTCNLLTFIEQSSTGTGMAFMVYAEVVINMPGSQVWSVLFFVMFFSVGLCSVLGHLQGVLTPLKDLHLIPPWIPKEVSTGILCLIAFAISLTFTLGSGNYWLGSFNLHVGPMSVIVIGFFEMISVAYIYGVNRFNDDIESLTGQRPNIYWQVTWRFITPLMLLVVFLTFIVVEAEKLPTYDAWNPNYVEFPFADVLYFPDWAFAILVFLFIIMVISIPLVALYRFTCFLQKHITTRHNLNPFADSLQQ